ncbi:MAG: acyl-CoA dehydrogenase family protein [Rhodospirillales bacterium]
MLSERALALVPALAERAAATEAARRVPAETVAEYHRTGILRALQPKRFGGAQQSFAVFSQIVETLAQGCASSAWVYAVLAEHQWIVACMPDRAQIDVWGNTPDAVVSSSLAPRHNGVPVDGGWRLSGDFPFSSGCDHAQWALLGARAEDAAGNKPTRYMLVPMADIEILDDWHVLGLRGTGSKTLRLTDVFVPAHRTVLLGDLLSGRTPGAALLPEYSLLRAPRGFLVPFSLPPVTFSLARKALAMVPAALRSRLSRGTRDLGDSEVVQLHLAEAGGDIDLASLILHTRRAESMALLDSDRPPSVEDAARNRRDISYASEMVRRGVERLVEIAGSRTMRDGDPLQSILRDVTTIATHAVVLRQMNYVPYGRAMLGLPPAMGEA